MLRSAWPCVIICEVPTSERAGLVTALSLFSFNEKFVCRRGFGTPSAQPPPRHRTPATDRRRHLRFSARALASARSEGTSSTSMRPAARRHPTRSPPRWPRCTWRRAATPAPRTRRAGGSRLSSTRPGPRRPASSAARPTRSIFGANMTSLNFTLSRTLGRQLSAGDEIVVTRLDHDANVAPWLDLAADRGPRGPARGRARRHQPGPVRPGAPARPADARSWRSRGPRTRPARSSTPARSCDLAHQAGALAWVDAVQYAAHEPMDVQAIDADVVIVLGLQVLRPAPRASPTARRDLLESWKPYKARPVGVRARSATGSRPERCLRAARRPARHLRLPGQPRRHGRARGLGAPARRADAGRACRRGHAALRPADDGRPGARRS